MRHLPRRGFEGVGHRSAFGQRPPDLPGATALQFPDRRQLERRRRADETRRRKAHPRGHRQPGGLCSIAYTIKAGVVIFVPFFAAVPPVGSTLTCRCKGGNLADVPPSILI